MSSEKSAAPARRAEMDTAVLRRARELVSHSGSRGLRTAGGAAFWLEHGGPDAPGVAGYDAAPGTVAPALAARSARLAVLADAANPLLKSFAGESADAGAGLKLLRAATTPANAAALRTALTNLQPVPLGLMTSAGFGDRLGLATPGHTAAMDVSGATGKIGPIFAQQSIREMTRTRRSAQQVMDDATWGAFEAGWLLPLGADADHLKTEEDVRSCLTAGFTLFTIDPGEHVDDSAESATESDLRAKLERLPWAALDDDWASLKRRLLGSPTDADGLAIDFEEEALARAAVKYGAALAHTARLHRVLAASGAAFEVELSVDETSYPTKLVEHAYVALELGRLGVNVISLAPRFVGRFEKGVDFRPDASGDHQALVRSLDGHARIARALGPYKLSLHSGSDKFSVYAAVAEATRGMVHLKTAGTSYLEALRVAAVHGPELFRRVLDIGLTRFETDRKSYLIGARLEAVPRPGELSDAELPALLDDDDARQVLHVTFGSALDALGRELKELLGERWQAHDQGLARHFERHLSPFVPFAGANSRPARSS